MNSLIPMLLIAATISVMNVAAAEQPGEDTSQNEPLPAPATLPRHELAAAFIAAEDPERRGRLAARLVQEAYVLELKQLQHGKHHGIALIAAWERLRRQVAAEFLGSGPQGALQIATIPKDVTSAFIAFTEGRLNLEVPPAWKRNIQTLRISATGLEAFSDTAFADLAHSQSLHPKRKDFFSSGFPVPDALNPTARLVRVDGLTLLKISQGQYKGDRSQSVCLPQPLVQELRAELSEADEDPNVFGVATDDLAVIGFYHPGGWKLVGLRPDRPRLPAEVLWTQTISEQWNAPEGMSSIGYLELRTQDGLFYAFTSMSNAIGVTAIAPDGSIAFSFNSGYRREE